MANNFSSDPNCVALWRFESGALTVDSKGSNTLTDVNTVGESTGEYKEGFCCADFESDNSEYLYITDSDLDAGFPLKSGDTTKIISVCFWIKLESTVGGGMGIINKYKTTGNKRSFLASSYNSKLRIINGYNGGESFEGKSYGTAFSTGVWYHVGIVHDGVNKTIFARIWDDNANDYLDVDLDTSWANETYICDCDFQIGPYYATTNFLDGKLDELVIFKDKLTADEIDQIRQGTYGGGGTTKQISDTGQGSDAIASLAVSLAVSDTGQGQDATADMSAALSALDSGSGIDTLAQILADLGISDIGGGDDAVAQISADLTVSDSSTGADSLSAISVTFQLDDSASGADAVNVITEILKTVSDNAAGNDQVSGVIVSLSVPDSGTGTDAPVISVTLTLSDTASAVDAVNVITETLKIISDSAAGTDAVAGISVSVPVTDTAQGIDTVAGITVLLSVSDIAAGSDVVIKYDDVAKIVTISFSLKKRSASFGVKKRYMKFTLH